LEAWAEVFIDVGPRDRIAEGCGKKARVMPNTDNAHLNRPESSDASVKQTEAPKLSPEACPCQPFDSSHDAQLVQKRRHVKPQQLNTRRLSQGGRAER
jgi:hypothetical protein